MTNEIVVIKKAAPGERRDDVDRDEWYGNIYSCPACTPKHYQGRIWGGFSFCPDCGRKIQWLDAEAVK